MSLLFSLGRWALYGAAALFGWNLYSRSTNVLQLGVMMFAAYGAAKYFKVVK